MLCTEIQIPEGLEIDLEKSDLKTGTVWFKKIEPKYPQSVNVIETIDFHVFSRSVSTPERAKSFESLMRLVELRDAWNKIDGFEAGWNNRGQYKYCLYRSRDGIGAITHETTYKVLHFGSPETRDLFLKTFRDLIETAKELI